MVYDHISRITPGTFSESVISDTLPLAVNQFLPSTTKIIEIGWCTCCYDKGWVPYRITKLRNGIKVITRTFY